MAAFHKCFTFDTDSKKLCLIVTPSLQCGVADGEGFLSIWQVNQTAANPKPYMVSVTLHSQSVQRPLVYEVSVSDREPHRWAWWERDRSVRQPQPGARSP